MIGRGLLKVRTCPRSKVRRAESGAAWLLSVFSASVLVAGAICNPELAPRAVASLGSRRASVRSALCLLPGLTFVVVCWARGMWY